jgi:hypothetical protein
VNAITSWRTRSSISATRAGSTAAFARITASDAGGIKPRSACTSHTASSTSSQRAYLPSSLKIPAISGRE